MGTKGNLKFEIGIFGLEAFSAEKRFLPKSIEANDRHEPCEAASDYITAQQNKQAHYASPIGAAPTGMGSASTRFSEMTTGKITAIYHAALRKPNVDSTYNVNGKVMSLRELTIYIWHLSCRVSVNF